MAHQLSHDFPGPSNLFDTDFRLICNTFFTSISGTVTSASDGEPIPVVNLLLEGTNRGAATDLDGIYTIEDVEPGNYMIIVRYIGYRPITQRITVEAGEQYTIDFESIERVEVLKGAAAALNHLLDHGVLARAAHQPFVSATRVGEVEFGYGSVIVPVAEQHLDGDELYSIIEETAAKYSQIFYAADTGLNIQGIDLGSRHSQVVDKPEAAIVFGEGVRYSEAGEAWFLLNRHLGLNLTKIDSGVFPGADLQRYKTIILVDGDYTRWNDETVDALRGWVRKGNTLITSGRATQWVINEEIVTENLLEEDTDSTSSGARFNYETRDDRSRANTIPGVILEADIDPSNPVAFGVSGRSQLFIKQSSNFLNQSENPYATVAQFTDDPLVGGFVNNKNLEKIRGAAAIVIAAEGDGNVILFSENPNFRSYWHTTSRLFINAILFGRNIQI